MRVPTIILAGVTAACAAAIFVAAQVSERARTPSRPGAAGSSAVLTRHLPPEMREQMKAAAKPSNDAALRALKLFWAGDVTGAEVECRKALALAPKDNGEPVSPIGSQLMGDICLRLGKNREALRWFLGSARHIVGGTANLGATDRLLPTSASTAAPENASQTALSGSTGAAPPA